MCREGILALEEIGLEDALAMHGHMLDFKKRGTFIRLGWRRAMGKPVPDYGYCPASISTSRKLVELVIALIFGLCRTRVARKLVEWIPLGLMGPLFDTLRKSWKRASKPVKRKGLGGISFEVTG